jgi:hypothetical protein
VNDLDLELIDPDGKKYLPWTLDPLPLTTNPGNGAQDPIQSSDVDPAYRGVDHINNVEMVSVCLPKAGVWKAKVKGFSLPNGNAQPYSLVSSHDIMMWCFIIGDFCQKFPWYCNIINLCDRHPELCDFKLLEPDIIYIDKMFIFNPKDPFEIDEICKYVIDCPGCEGSGWAYCPGWQMRIENLPRDANIVLFNQDSKILLTNTTGLPSRDVTIKERRPGEQQFLLITDRAGKPYPKILSLKIGIKPI